MERELERELFLENALQAFVERFPNSTGDRLGQYLHESNLAFSLSQSFESHLEHQPEQTWGQLRERLHEESSGDQIGGRPHIKNPIELVEQRWGVSIGKVATEELVTAGV